MISHDISSPVADDLIPFKKVLPFLQFVRLSRFSGSKELHLMTERERERERKEENTC